jgi:hypothetical protein
LSVWISRSTWCCVWCCWWCILDRCRIDWRWRRGRRRIGVWHWCRHVGSSITRHHIFWWRWRNDRSTMEFSHVITVRPVQ